MNTNITHEPTIIIDRPGARFARRAALIVALCALVATLTATWLSSSPASAGPGKPAKAAKAPAPAATVTTIDDDGAEPAAADEAKPKKAKKSKAKVELTGKLNLNTASVEQLSMLPGVGPSKAERVIDWRGKNGGFKRVADLRKVKGFGYKTLKKLEPYLDVKGENTLSAK
jgi:competence protein ComEA